MKAKKTLTLVLCMVLVAALSVAGTLAYLTSEDTVTNTFTVGEIEITMDEADTDEYGEEILKDGKAVDRVTENAYLLVPGHEYKKDPVVHVTANSEASWLFVRITNDIAAIEDKNATIAAQITANGWTELKTDVYYQQHSKNTTDDVDYPVFETFTIGGDVDNTTLADYEGETVMVEAFAIQQMELSTAAEAWAALGE